MTKEEFLGFYAEIYAAADGDAVLDLFVDNAYEALAEDWETGTYTIRLNQIMCTITGGTGAEALKYSIDGDTLVLTYVNAVETYTRSN